MKVQIKSIGSVQEVSDKFKKLELVGVVEYEGQYPQPILWQLSQDKVSLADGLTPGDIVEVDYNLRGRIWQNPEGVEKVFNTLEIWKLTVIEKAGQSHSVESTDPPF